jgi:hypothetical protein
LLVQAGNGGEHIVRFLVWGCLRSLGALVAALLCAAGPMAGPAFAQSKRVALVIGNSDYKHTSSLQNPKNDASDVAAKLKGLGFAVVEGLDIDKAAADRTIRDFAEKLAGADVGLLFYAGHALQVDGQNYLVPTDARLTTASAIDFEMVRLDLVLRTMERETATNIIIIDACRDNPLARNLARALGTRSTQIGHGLASVESGEGTLISFSTQPGNVALDGEGRNSPFTAALLEHIAAPGDDLSTILINVRNDVMRATAKRQVPWEHSAMTAKFYFVAPTPPRPTVEQLELTFWMSVKDSTSPAVLGTYLERYPNGEFAPIARALIEHYNRQLQLDLAARETERKRREEEMRTAEAKRLEEEQRAREAALAEERKRAEADKSSEEAKLAQEKQLAEIKKALEEARLAGEAAQAAEQKRLAAVKAAEVATRDAEQAIAAKRDAEKTSRPEKLAALPKIEKPAAMTPAGNGAFDGTWLVHRLGPTCPAPDVTFHISVDKGQVSGRLAPGDISGTVSASGQITFRHPSTTGGVTLQYSAHLGKGTGSGTFTIGVGSLSQMQIRQLAAQAGQKMCYGTIALTCG